MSGVEPSLSLSLVLSEASPSDFFPSSVFSPPGALSSGGGSALAVRFWPKVKLAVDGATVEDPVSVPAAQFKAKLISRGKKLLNLSDSQNNSPIFGH